MSRPRMLTPALAAVLALALPLVALVATPAQAAPALRSGGACAPKLTKIKGKQAVINCGPATATLAYGGHTYTFKNGTCAESKTIKFQVNLGTLVVGPADNAGYPEFGITVIGTGSSTIATIQAHHGKVSVNGPVKVTLKGKSGAKFSGSTIVGSDTPFSGSIKCGGAVTTVPGG